MSTPSWLRVLPSKVVIGCATLGPLGRRLPAPGTWGSLAGLLFFAVFLRHAGIGALLVVGAITAWIAAGICGEAEVRMRKKDPGEVVLDEVVAMPLCFLGWQALPAAWPPWAIFVLGFLLFRFFDILKPLGISRLQRWPGGWGVVADDTAAALAACAALHVGAWIRTLL